LTILLLLGKILSLSTGRNSIGIQNDWGEETSTRRKLESSPYAVIYIPNIEIRRWFYQTKSWLSSAHNVLSFGKPIKSQMRREEDV
jgi:hypothetical protein